MDAVNGVVKLPLEGYEAECVVADEVNKEEVNSNSDLPPTMPMDSNGFINEYSTGTQPPSLPTNSPPTVDTSMNISTKSMPAAAVDRSLKRRIKKIEAFALGLVFASLGFLSFSKPHSGDHFAIALVLKFIVFIVSLFLYLCSGPKFLKVQVTMLVFCVGLLVLAIFLARHA